MGIETLVDLGAIPNVLFLMPPGSATFEVRPLWQGAAAMMRGYGFSLPEYRPDGLIFRLTADGSLAESIPFDAIWDDTLFARIEHLLAADENAAPSPSGPVNTPVDQYQQRQQRRGGIDLIDPGCAKTRWLINQQTLSSQCPQSRAIPTFASGAEGPRLTRNRHRPSLYALSAARGFHCDLRMRVTVIRSNMPALVKGSAAEKAVASERV